MHLEKKKVCKQSFYSRFTVQQQFAHFIFQDGLQESDAMTAKQPEEIPVESLLSLESFPPETHSTGTRPVFGMRVLGQSKKKKKGK